MPPTGRRRAFSSDARVDFIALSSYPPGTARIIAVDSLRRRSRGALPRPAGYFAATTDALRIFTGSTGTFAIAPLRVVGTETMASATSIPSTTVAKTA